MKKLTAITNDVIESAKHTLMSGKLFRYDCSEVYESKTALLEEKVCKMVDAKYAVAMNSCSSALFVSLLCAGVKAGDKIAIPAFTFIAVPSAVVHANAIPVLIEVDKNYVIDLKDLEKKIQEEHIKVLLLSYMRGRIPDLDKVIQLCKQYNVILIEDAAHALGTFWHGKQVGTFGLIGAYSAQSYKLVDSGEGGILVTNDKLSAFKAMLYSGCYEQNWKKHFGTSADQKLLINLTNSIPAYNFRMSNLSAAVLIPQLDNLEEKIAFYNSKYNMLVSILKQSNYIRIPEFIIGTRSVHDSIQWEFIGLDSEQIFQIKEDLKFEGIVIDVFTGDNARCFWNWSFFSQNEQCTFTKNLLQRTIDMRLRLHLTMNEIEKIGNKILEVVSKNVK